MDGLKCTYKCDGCGADYAPTLNGDGTPRKTKYRVCSDTCSRSAYSKASYRKRDRQSVGIVRDCATCMISFTATQSSQHYCSAQCRNVAKREKVKASPIMSESRRARDAKRRALKKSTQVERIEPIKVFERDCWRCHICGAKTLKSKRGTQHPLAPELEHVVSLADGGTHTWGNVACACSRCNRLKGPASFGQVGMNFAA